MILERSPKSLTDFFSPDSPSLLDPLKKGSILQPIPVRLFTKETKDLSLERTSIKVISPVLREDAVQIGFLEGPLNSEMEASFSPCLSELSMDILSEPQDKTHEEEVVTSIYNKTLLSRGGRVELKNGFSEKSALTVLPQDEGASLFDLYEVFNAVSVERKLEMIPHLLKYKSFVQALKSNVLLCLKKIAESSSPECQEANRIAFFLSLFEQKEIQSLSKDDCFNLFSRIIATHKLIPDEKDLFQDPPLGGLTKKECAVLYKGLFSLSNIDMSRLADKAPINHKMIICSLLFQRGISLNKVVEGCVEQIDFFSDPSVRERLSVLFFSALFESESIEFLSKKDMEEVYSLPMSKECKFVISSFLLEHRNFQEISETELWSYFFNLYQEGLNLEEENVSFFVQLVMNHPSMQKVSADHLIALVKADNKFSYLKKEQLRDLARLFNFRIDTMGDSDKMKVFYNFLFSHPVWNGGDFFEIQRFVFED